MTKFFQSKDAVQMLGVSENTLRGWRKQGKDFDQVAGADSGKNHKYTRRGLLALAVMQQVKASGASLETAFQVAFWGVAEVSHWLDIWDIEPMAGSNAGVVLKTETRALSEWAICPIRADDNPIITDNPSYISDFREPVDTDEITTLVVVDLKAIARALPARLVAELKGG